jgi:hypothetical protein
MTEQETALQLIEQAGAEQWEELVAARREVALN